MRREAIPQAESSQHRARRSALLSPFSCGTRNANIETKTSPQPEGETSSSLLAALASLDAASEQWNEANARVGQSSQSVEQLYDRMTTTSVSCGSTARHEQSMSSSLQRTPICNHAALRISDNRRDGGTRNVVQPLRPDYLRAQRRQNLVQDGERISSVARPLIGGPSLGEMRQSTCLPTPLVSAEQGSQDGSIHSQEREVSGHVSGQSESCASTSKRPRGNTEVRQSIPQASSASKSRTTFADCAADVQVTAAVEASGSFSSSPRSAGKRNAPLPRGKERPLERAMSWSERRDRRNAKRRRSPPMTRTRAAQLRLSQVRTGEQGKESGSTCRDAQAGSAEPPRGQDDTDSSDEFRSEIQGRDLDTDGKLSKRSRTSDADLTVDITDPSFGEDVGASVSDAAHTERRADVGHRREPGARQRRNAKQTAGLQRRLELTLTDSEGDWWLDNETLQFGNASITESEKDPVVIPGEDVQKQSVSSSQTQSDGSLVMSLARPCAPLAAAPPAADANEGHDSSQSLTEDEQVSDKETRRRAVQQSRRSNRKAMTIRRARRRQDLF